MATQLDDVFLQDILAHPDEDAPRLIYADWLEEQADNLPVGTSAPPRGEFIRVQCRLADMPEDAPQRWRLLQRQQELLTLHQDDWLGELRQLGRDWVFQRGFVSRGTLHLMDFLRAQERLFALVPLRGLGLSGERSAHSLRQLARSPGLERLHALSLLWWLEAEEVTAVLSSPHLCELRQLHIEMRYGGPITLQALASALTTDQLQRLEIAWGSWLRGNLLPLLRSPKLRGLTALKVNLEEVTPAELAELPLSLPQLQELDIRLPRFSTAVPLSLLEPVGARLRELRLSCPTLSPQAFCWVAELFAGRPLQHLRLDCRLASGDTRCWRSLTPLPGLRRLELPYCGMSPPAVEDLAGSPLLSGVTSLDLQGSYCGDPGIQALARSPYLSQLRCLNLHFTAVSDEGVAALASSPNLSNLVYLNLTANRLSDSAARILARSPHLDSLVHLDLDRNPMTQRGEQLLFDRFGPEVLGRPLSERVES